MIWLGLILAVWLAVFLLAYRWAVRHAEAADPDEPVPYWPAANPCTWCQVRPEGICTCPSVCPHANCVGDHTSLAVFRDEDWDKLQALLREGDE